MRDNLKIVARPKGAYQAFMDKDLVWLTGSEFEDNVPDATAQLANRGSPDHLYFIQIGPGPVKIGRAGDVRQRMGQIQCASPYDIELLATITGGGQYERRVHLHLRECRIRGEWFRWTNIVSDLVECVKVGGDWEALLREFDTPPVPNDDWRIGSPLYQGNPKYPQFQWPPVTDVTTPNTPTASQEDK